MTALPLRFLAPALVGASVIALAACGGGAEARAPMSVGVTEEPATVEGAQEEIARLHEQLRGDPAPSGDAQRVVPAQPVVPATAPPGPPSTPSVSAAGKGASQAAPSTEESRCSNPCRALASMRRAVTALCRMTGDIDIRCVDAKRTLSDSERSVSRCSC